MGAEGLYEAEGFYEKAVFCGNDRFTELIAGRLRLVRQGCHDCGADGAGQTDDGETGFVETGADIPADAENQEAAPKIRTMYRRPTAILTKTPK